MLRTDPRLTPPSLRERLLPLLSAPDAAGAHATAAGLGALLVFAVLWIVAIPALLVGFVGAVALVLLVAGVVLPLLVAIGESL